MSDVTRILQSIQAGDKSALEDLLPLVYDELRKLARARLAKEKPSQTLQATALVHEAYVRLVGKEAVEWNSRGHFFGAAAEAMRRILIEQARKRQTEKHGGALRRIELSTELTEPTRDDKLIQLDQALTKLEADDAIKAKLVKLRFFAGLTMREVAEALDISTSTADRYWVYSRAWIQREMNASERD